MTLVHKALLSIFLSQNPFPNPLTLGFFFREKMRAIHFIAPDRPFQRILEIGGGRSGLTALLYPLAKVINLDINPAYSKDPCNQKHRIGFLGGDAIFLPFKDHSFDAVTMFDLLEHVPNHNKAVAEAFRVLRPGGFCLISTPNENWRFPYYGFMKTICPTEAEIMAEWGHVRRGFSLFELMTLIDYPCRNYATFISPITVLCHDISFSLLGLKMRRNICSLLAPLTWLGYMLHKLHIRSKGTETASVWEKN